MEQSCVTKQLKQKEKTVSDCILMMPGMTSQPAGSKCPMDRFRRQEHDLQPFQLGAMSISRRALDPTRPQNKKLPTAQAMESVVDRDKAQWPPLTLQVCDGNDGPWMEWKYSSHRHSMWTRFLHEFLVSVSVLLGCCCVWIPGHEKTYTAAQWCERYWSSIQLNLQFVCGARLGVDTPNHDSRSPGSG